MSDLVQVGCMKCKRARARKVQKTLDMLLGPFFDKLQAEAAKNGIALPNDFEAKMDKWCRKRGLLPPTEEVPLAFPQNLD